MLVVQRLGSGPWSTDEFHSHKTHKKLATVPMAVEDMKVFLPRGDRILGLLSVILLHQPKASSRPFMEDGSLVLQCVQLYFLWGFQRFCRIYITLFSLPAHLTEFNSDWEATENRPLVLLLFWCKSSIKVVILVTVVKSQPSLWASLYF